MLKPSFIKKLLSLTTFLPIVATAAATTQSYQPPRFTDETRLARIQSILPKLNEIYKNYAEKNHFPGYAYGIIVDDKLIYANSGGYADIEKKNASNTCFRLSHRFYDKKFHRDGNLKITRRGQIKAG